jgi:DNA repair ATPase RecN
MISNFLYKVKNVENVENVENIVNNFKYGSRKFYIKFLNLLGIYINYEPFDKFLEANGVGEKNFKYKLNEFDNTNNYRLLESKDNKESLDNLKFVVNELSNYNNSLEEFNSSLDNKYNNNQADTLLNKIPKFLNELKKPNFYSEYQAFLISYIRYFEDTF